MKKNDIFTFTAPNGVDVTAVVLESIFQGSCKNTLICYAQNRLFTIKEERCIAPVAVDTDEFGDDIFEEQECVTQNYGEVLVDYAILPDYDAILENYQHRIDITNDYADKTF